MNINKNQIAYKPTLEFTGVRSYLFTLFLIALAVILPAAAHLTGAPVRILLPMHWSIILAGLVYGWRCGLVSGMLAPTVSFLISGMPYPALIFPMTVELAAYGVIIGLLREKYNLNAFLSVIIGLAAGRILFLITLLITGLTIDSGYLTSAILPGLAAAVVQIIVLPFIAKWWIKKENNSL
jgi:niacin transporter